MDVKGNGQGTITANGRGIPGSQNAQVKNNSEMPHI
jgi:hypothetical protein